ncbi:hypothetical protein MH117_00995 [Paenibacillus sp. ACRRX]|uniref:phage tail length tape measure family protein n=1 Tax=unclassified Paenibacillus TaxID=185978 RepID=UPI001EF4CC3A|nr:MULTISPECIES: hypothetical protein [unclassified Paenibacillus]MCG7405978.1 hypothetical protein [Paenibacillus sp. ACRRX]MDK8182431.1 hypothetical protein [Paenibacillus sp. UMB4589-SE434]
MVEWSVAVATGAWLVLCFAAVIAIWRGLSLVRQASQSLSLLNTQSTQLVQQLSDLTRRGDQALKKAEEAAEQLAEWRETIGRTRNMVEGWNSRLARWSERTESAVEAAHQANERRIQDTLQWADLAYTFWSDIQTRRQRSTSHATPDKDRLD